MTAIYVLLIVLLLLFIGFGYYIGSKRMAENLVNKYRPYLLYGRILRK